MLILYLGLILILRIKEKLLITAIGFQLCIKITIDITCYSGKVYFYPAFISRKGIFPGFTVIRHSQSENNL